MAMTTTAPADAAQTADRLRIDFLFLDLTTCSRCRGTDRNLESALEVVRDLLEATGIEVEVNKIHVESAEQARELRFVSSPTIRVNGSDIALELRESLCGCDACTDGCGEGISCRVWVHRGREYTEAPAAVIVDAILRQVYGRAAEREPAAEPYELPENLERFFAGQGPGPSSRGAGGNTLLPAGTEETSCCSPGQQRSCCDPKDEAECCGASPREGLGCR